MAQQRNEWEDLGRNIRDIVDRAVSAQDYQKLNQTIRQVVDRAVDLGEETVRKVVDSAASGKTQAAQPVVKKQDLSVLYGPTGGKTAIGVLKIVGGSILSALSLAMLLASAVVGMVMSSAALALPVGAVAALAGGAGLIGNGVSNLNRLSRFKRYRALLGEKTQCTLERLARGVGKSERFVRREVKRMISQRLFLEGHLDREEQTLIISDETYQLFEQSRVQLEQRQQEQKRLAEAEKARRGASALTPQIQEVLDKGDAFVAQIRRCNDAIPGQEISAKISRMELIVQRIFDQAESNPEIIPDLKKMMDYYLPMTVKLLNAYAEMDAQPVQGETILASKREIEGTLDTLNMAFEKLLDSIFEDTALDVSSDISVLHTLLAQEGLTEDGLSQVKRQRKGE